MSNELYVFLNTTAIYTWKKAVDKYFQFKTEFAAHVFLYKNKCVALFTHGCFGLKVVGISIKYIQCKQI